MWLPFFDLPCELPKDQLPLSSVKSKDNVSNGSNSPGKGLSVAQTAVAEASAEKSSSSRSPPAASAASKASAKKGKLGPGPLRKGAVGIGQHQESISIQGLRIQGGNGRCLAGVPVVQDRAYWELHVAEASVGSDLMVGVAARGAEDHLKERLGETARSYGVAFGLGGHAIKVGDVVGVAYDQAVFPVSVVVWLNGEQVDAPMARGLKGEMWPAIFLSEAVVDWALGEEHWKSKPPQGYDPLMPSRGLIGGD
eukprot:TRINITY_DN27980_c0_g1_i2.p1 TRINITY_DN27980_c0_g1~~TRINITY_DN27980_c0_g1_i2.p1  ORF type:complete len:252 (+),score=42.99 TRINITY_DN27980_c0_g1_i2:39-794(+)